MQRIVLAVLALFAVPGLATWLLPHSDLAGLVTMFSGIGILVVALMWGVGVGNLRWFVGLSLSAALAYAWGSLFCPAGYYHPTGFFTFLSVLCYGWGIMSVAHDEAMAQYYHHLQHCRYTAPSRWRLTIRLERSRF